MQLINTMGAETTLEAENVTHTTTDITIKDAIIKDKDGTTIAETETRRVTAHNKMDDSNGDTTISEETEDGSEMTTGETARATITGMRGHNNHEVMHPHGSNARIVKYLATRYNNALSTKKTQPYQAKCKHTQPP